MRAKNPSQNLKEIQEKYRNAIVHIISNRGQQESIPAPTYLNKQKMAARYI